MIDLTLVESINSLLVSLNSRKDVKDAINAQSLSMELETKRDLVRQASSRAGTRLVNEQRTPVHVITMT